MNIVRINLRNVIFVVIALLSSTIKEAHMGYESLASYGLREVNANSTPAYSNKKEELYGTCPTGIPCSEVGGDCLKCELTAKCVYGKSYAVNCTVAEQIDCVGDRTFEKKVVCRYCYQTEHWEHECLQKNSCSSVASPQQHYRTNCTVNDDIVCLGRRRFMKNLPCNWTGGYRWSTALILSITLGGFGADRFYLGHWQEGIGKLFSFGGLGVWTLIDVMLISIRYLGPADVPAKKGSKRTAATPAKGVKPAKVIKKKDEFALRPDLRRYKDGGMVLAVGQGDVGQLGLGTQYMEKMRPAPIPECQDIVCIAAGGMHSVCLTKAGTIYTFGCNDEGALGRDTSVEDSETTPGLVELDGKAVQVTAGDSHSAALLEDGRVFAWGSFRDSHGNMGLTLKGNERTPVQMLPGQKIVKISSGADHLIFLTENGYVYTCGCAEQGQLGRICTRSADRHSRRGVAQLLTPSPVQFNRSKNAKAEDIWAGSYCTFVKTYEKGEIHVFGLNNYHQLGMSRAGTYSFPCKSKTFDGRKWKHISSGQHHTLALDEAGQVFVLGRKEYGRLGLGDNCEDAKELTMVPDFTNLKCIDVAAGSAQSFAITDKGDLYAWGMGSNGQLGTGEEEDVSVPTVIRGKQWMKDNKVAVRVVGGGQHTLILAALAPIKD